MKTIDNVMKVPFVDLKAQYELIADEVDAAIMDVIHRTAFIMGDEVRQFEQEFADYCGAKYAVGVDSGTTALELALRAYDIGPGDEVITQANTFIATALAISATGATPVLVDIDPETYLIDVAAIRGAITEKTKAIMPVHLYGQPADMDPIMELAEKHGLVVIEDSAQAHGARYKGRRTGSLGHTAAFSLYPSKNLGAYGDAGIVVTDDPEVADNVNMLHNYGQRKKYHHEEIGYNHRLDTVQAAVLHVKLKYLDAWNAARQRHAELYNELLAESNVVTPIQAEDRDHVWHLYVIRTKQRDALQEALQAKGISTVIHYPIPVHLQKAYESLGYKSGDFPNTEQFAREIVSLPMYSELTSDQIMRVANAVTEFTG